MQLVQTEPHRVHSIRTEKPVQELNWNYIQQSVSAKKSDRHNESKERRQCRTKKQVLKMCILISNDCVSTTNSNSRHYYTALLLSPPHNYLLRAQQDARHLIVTNFANVWELCNSPAALPRFTFFRRMQKAIYKIKTSDWSRRRLAEWHRRQKRRDWQTQIK